MPTRDRRDALDLQGARECVAECGFPRTSRHAPAMGIGLEPEMFALRVDADGAPGPRVPLYGGEDGPPTEDSVLGTVDRLAREEDWLEPRDPDLAAPRFELAQGGSLTFEPGGQVEHSTAVHETGAAALRDLERTRAVLCGAFRARGAALAKAGIDVWHDVEEVPQQLRAPRYRSMAAYFDLRSGAGRVMMRNTATMQVNLDLGAPGEAEERWRLSNLVSPFVTATFAASPGGDGAASRRALAWQELDPTRTGFPRLFVEGPGDDPAGEILRAALEADVLLFRLGGDDAATGEPGLSFEAWMREGHPGHGWPTADDFRYHLTTLFMEVRCRGFLEFRACDALPEPWDAAPAVLLSGLLYDGAARSEGLRLLDPLRERLPELWRAAARTGLADADLGELAPRLWDLAVGGALRLPPGWFDEEHLRATTDFLDRFTRKGTTPSDELRAALAASPAEALRWAAGDAPCPERQPAPARP